MDPDETLVQIRSLIERLRSDLAKPSISMTRVEHAALNEKAEALVGMVDELDGWMARGGFLPAPWKVPEHEAPAFELGPIRIDLGKCIAEAMKADRADTDESNEMVGRAVTQAYGLLNLASELPCGRCGASTRHR